MQKNGWEKFKDGCKEYWKLLVTVAVVIVAIAVIVLCPASAVFLLGLAKGVLLGVGIGALSGLLFGELGGLGQMLGGSCKVLAKLGKVAEIVPHLARVSSKISRAMLGFDLMAFGISLFHPNVENREQLSLTFWITKE